MRNGVCARLWQGPVFHTPLGHDTTALGNDAVGKLLRRGTAWAMGIGSAKP